MIFRPQPDLEVGSQVHRIVIDGDAALALVHRIGRIGMDEAAARHHGRRDPRPRPPLPGTLVYVKDQNNNVVRLLKTNPHGIFATYNPLLKGEYFFEIKDPKNTYFFDRMKVRVEETNTKILEFFSKELL